MLATGAWLAGVPELERAIVAVSSDMVATAPMADLLEEAGWTGGESISNCRLMVHYYRTTNDGRIAFGQGGHRHAFGGRVDNGFFAHGDSAEEVLRRDLVRLVPYAEGVEVTHCWGGPIDRTADGAPIFGRLPGAVPIVYGVGYSGNGVAPCLTAGKILASSALGRDDEWSGCGLNRGVDRALPARADPLLRRIRRPGRGEAQGEPGGRRPFGRPAHPPRCGARAPGLLPREGLDAERPRSGASPRRRIPLLG